MLYSDVNASTPDKNPQVVDVDAVIQSIKTIMNTRVGSLVFLPNFGIDVDNYIFEFIDDTGALILFQYIVNSITMWDPRVTLDLQSSSVIVSPDQNSYTATVAFQIKGFQGTYGFTQIIQ